MAASSSEPRWTGRSRGGAAGYLIFIWVLRRLGPSVARVLLVLPVAYFMVATHRRVRAAGELLRRVLGPAPAWRRLGRSFRLVYGFAECILDRVGAQIYGPAVYAVTSSGREHMHALAAQGRGFLMLSAHLGNYALASLVSGEHAPLFERLHVVMLDAEAEGVRRVMQSLGRRGPKIIAINRGEFPTLEILRALRAGNPVAMHGDRVIGEHYAMCDFLGSPAAFSTGPYAIAAAARVPVILTFAFREGPRRYTFVAEPPREIILDRQRRSEDLAAHAQWFADRVAVYARAHPYNWFNFYDFWAPPPKAAHQSLPR